MFRIEELHGRQLFDAINRSQYDPASSAGFYESFFVRANHPSRPLAVWLRYTILSPRGDPGATEGQLWGIFFDGDTSSKVSLFKSVPVRSCSFSRETLDVRIGDATLDDAGLEGRLADDEHELSWNLTYAGKESPAFLLPLSLYGGGFPKAKALTPIPVAVFSGRIEVDGSEIDVDGWRGSQNHNWGTKHTDLYAWGQVAGFDNDPDAFLECSTARVKIGPIWSPWLTNLVLRTEGRDLQFNSLLQAVRNRGRYDDTSWTIHAKTGTTSAMVSIEAPADRFVRLLYGDPPGGKKTCLNTKLARCSVRLVEAGRPPLLLSASCRAAFEIMTAHEGESP